MKKLLIVFFLVLNMFYIDAATNVPLVKPCGLGTKACPYRIGTPGELLYFAEVVNDMLDSIPRNTRACAILINDIDLSEVCGPEIGSWTPIGFYNNCYYGTFDGRNHRIDNLYVYSEDIIKSDRELDPSASWARGFFGIASDGSLISNLTIGSGYLYTKAHHRGELGAIAGSIGGKIYNCHNFAAIEGDCEITGGIVGLQACGFSEVERCSNAGYVSGTGHVGGITGGFGCGTTRNCYNIGKVEGKRGGYVGGIVGNTYETTIENCFSFGEVISKNGVNYCGGIVGKNLSVTNCYCYNTGYSSNEKNKDCFASPIDFENGIVFNKLNAVCPDTLWTQKVGEEALPSFISNKLSGIEYGTRKVEYICKGDSFAFKGNFYKETGVYHGLCEDCSELFLKVLGEDTTKLFVEIEEGETYEFGDDVLTSTGVYSRVLESHSGCDSVVSLDLQVLHRCIPTNFEFSEFICEGENFVWDSETFSEAGKYEKMYVSSSGCDSVVVLNLSVLPKSNTLIKETINQGESFNEYNFSIPMQEDPGIFTFWQDHTNYLGCDSVVCLELSVIEVKVIEPDTIPEIKPEVPDTIPEVEPELPDTEEKTEISEPEIEIPNVFTPYTEDGINDVFMANYTVYIYDRYGNLVCNSDNGWDGKYRGALADPGTYVYVLVLKNGEKKKGTIKVLKLK